MIGIPKNILSEKCFQQESITVGCVPPVFLIPGGRLPRQRPLGKNMGPGTETPKRNMGPGSQTGSDLQSPPPRQNGRRVKTLPGPKLRLLAVMIHPVRILQS